MSRTRRKGRREYGREGRVIRGRIAHTAAGFEPWRLCLHAESVMMTDERMLSPEGTLAKDLSRGGVALCGL